MITKLGHLGLACHDMAAAQTDYAKLLGCEAPDPEKRNNGYSICSFPLENTALELISGASETARGHLKNILGPRPKLTTLAWHIEGAPPIGSDQISDKVWRIPDSDAAGIKTFFVQEPAKPCSGAITQMDHVVLNTPNPVRAKAFYVERLGLDFAFEKTIDSLKAHIMFFRCGGLTLEIVHRLGDNITPDRLDGPDALWGIGWAVKNIDQQRARLDSLGIAHSGVRDGLKPKTKVLSVKSGTQQIPTLFIEHMPQEDS